MVSHYGRNIYKMFIRGKSIRFGYKLWYVCDRKATPYQDKEEAAYSIPLGTRVVDSLMHVIRTIQMLLNTSCFFITGVKFFVIDFSSMSIY